MACNSVTLLDVDNLDKSLYSFTQFEGEINSMFA